MTDARVDLGQIVAGVDVCASGGQTIGTVVAVHIRRPAKVGGQVDDRPSYVEVKTHPGDLGGTLYVPAAAIQAVTQGCLFLKDRYEAIQRADWRERPSSFDPPS
jgi:hypothetical protein